MSEPKDDSPIAGTQMLGTGDLAGPGPPPVPADASDPISGRTLDGRYLVGERLGAGGVGVVYAAQHVDIKKAVALKVLHPAFGQNEGLRLRFEREARAASQLSHPACVSVIDFGRVTRVDPPEKGEALIGMSYLVMERVRGDVLGDRTHGTKVEPREAIEIVRGVLSALRHAHGLGLVHRDVKPGNVMLSPAGAAERWVKLLDFGLAKSVISTDEQPLTEVGMVFGTPGYLSPEQAGGGTIDARSDLYSTGVLLFELLCGRPPFIGNDRIQVVRDHLLTPPPAPRSLAPELSPALEAVVLRALSKKPEDRFPTAEAFADALAAVPEANVTMPLPPAAPPQSPLMAALQRLSLQQRVLAGGVVALMIVGVALLLRPTQTPTATPSAPVTPDPTPAPTRGESRHLKMAIDYQRRLWCSDAIDELDKAMRDDASLGTSKEAIDVAVGCLRQKTQDKAIRFLVDNAGKTALPALAEVEAHDSRPDYRYGAARARSAILTHSPP